jgi:intein/homing endonuclease
MIKELCGGIPENTKLSIEGATYNKLCFRLIKTVIKSLEEGNVNKILSYNDKTGKLEFIPILSIIYIGKRKVLNFMLDNRTEPFKAFSRQSLAILENNKIIYKNAEDLKVGDTFLIPNYLDIRYKQILSIDLQKEEEHLYVVNVEKNKNYFAGNVLVHI